MLFAATGLLELLAVHGALLAVRVAPDQACPSAAQVSDALTARMPGAIIDSSESATAGAGAHAIEVTGEPGKPVLSVVDPTGVRRLQRVLNPSETGAKDCAALADTIAIIVERYLAELGIETAAPTPATAPAQPGATDNVEPVDLLAKAGGGKPVVVAAGSPALMRKRFEVALVPEGRSGHAGGSALGLYLEGRRTFEVPFIAFRLGGSAPTALAWQASSGIPGTGTLYGGRVEFAAGLGRDTGWGRVDLQVAVGLKLLLVQEGGARSGSGGHWGLGQDVGVGVAYTARMPRDVFVRVGVAGHLAVTRHAIVAPGATAAPGSDLLVETPRIFATLGVALGVAF